MIGFPPQAADPSTGFAELEISIFFSLGATREGSVAYHATQVLPASSVGRLSPRLAPVAVEDRLADGLHRLRRSSCGHRRAAEGLWDTKSKIRILFVNWSIFRLSIPARRERDRAFRGTIALELLVERGWFVAHKPSSAKHCSFHAHSTFNLRVFEPKNLKKHPSTERDFYSTLPQAFLRSLPSTRQVFCSVSSMRAAVHAKATILPHHE